MYTSTYKTFLMKGSGTGTTTYQKLVDITEFPDLGGEPELLDTTTLSDKMRTFILGIQNNEGMEFNANYDKADYQALKALDGVETPFAVWFGGTESGGVVTPTGSEGQFSFKGLLSVRITGGAVNEVRGMAITIAPTTVITETFPEG